MLIGLPSKSLTLSSRCPEVVDADRDLRLGRQRCGHDQAGLPNRAHVPSEELHDLCFTGRDHGEAAHRDERAQHQQEAANDADALALQGDTGDDAEYQPGPRRITVPG